MSNRMYVLTRRDLPKSVATVQSVHAAIEETAKKSITFDETPWVIVYGVNSEADLAQWADRLAQHNLTFTAFREPDMGDQLTAIAYWGRKPEGFGGLRLL